MIAWLSGNLRGRWSFTAIFAVWLIVGLATFADYGLSWDEPLMRDQVGRVNMDYITGRDRAAMDAPSFRDASYHGPALEIAAAGMEAAFGLSDSRQIYLARHLAQFLLFWLATVCFYRSCRLGPGGRPQALLAATLLVLMPRIYADAFYNIKDLGFLSCWVIAIHLALRFERVRTPYAALAAGAAAAFATDVRVIGLLLPVFTVVIYLHAGGWRLSSGWLRPTAAYTAAFCVILLAFWPRLWRNPPLELMRAIENNRHFPYNSMVWYFGQSVRAHELPWHYLPVWIAISVPLITLAFSLYGCVAAMLSGRALLSPARRPEFAFLALSVVPIALVVVLRSPIYDGWRHLYFIAPAIACLAAAGWARLAAQCGASLRGRLGHGLLAVLLVASLSSTAFWMFRSHPYQNLYFNRLAGPDAQSAKLQFEFDYFGLGYREGFVRLLKKDPSPEVRVSVANDAGEFAVLMLPPADRARVHLVGEYPLSSYFLGNYRWNAKGYFFSHIDLEQIECVGVGNACAVGVFRILPPGTQPRDTLPQRSGS